jgi:hypothetical protein
MPRIADYILQCSVYLYSSLNKADRGAPCDGASGFLVSVPARRADLSPHIYVVTNSHVIENGARVISFNTSGGLRQPLELTTGWYCAEEADLAVILLAEPKGIHSCIPLEFFVTDNILDELDLGVGDEVFMVGRLIRDEEEVENNPVIRFGRIACPLMPLVNIWGEEVFLAEYRSLGKASGSPVFLEFSRRSRDSRGGKENYVEYLLLGVNRGSTRYRMPVEGIEGDAVSIDSSISMVVPACKLKALLERGDVSEQRKTREDAIPPPSDPAPG